MRNLVPACGVSLLLARKHVKKVSISIACKIHHVLIKAQLLKLQPAHPLSPIPV